MNYSRIQKIISSFLLFIFFFGQIFGLSFFSLFSSSVFADAKDFHNLVSIIVNEEVYDELDYEVERYAEDIQNYLENTKAVIIPIGEDTTAFQIASINESLFFEGYKSLKDVNFESKLVGTVLIGDMELPIVEDSDKTIKSILPFVDFEDKRFIYNIETNFFEDNGANINGLKAEVFHGVISPNSGDSDENIKQIKDFLDKDHDFYVGENNFDSDIEVLNGKLDEDISGEYEPYVFYFDELREQKSLSYSAYEGYRAYLNNKEDLVYNRYSKDFAKELQEEVLGAQNKELDQLLDDIEDPEIKKAFEKFSGPNLEASSDIALRHLIDGVTNNFLEVFNKGTISDFRTNVHNAGRYNIGKSKVNVDMIPYLISVLDKTTDNIIKSGNNDLEEYIFSEVSPDIVHEPFPVNIYSGELLPKTPDQYKSGGGGGLIFGLDLFLIKSNSIELEDISFNEEGLSFDDSGLSIKINDLLELLKVSEVISFDGEGDLAEMTFKIQSYPLELITMKVSVYNKILLGLSSKYDNFYNGQPAEYLPGEPSPEYCSIYRGNTENGGQLVELNHGFNSRNGQNDTDLILDCEEGDLSKATLGYWGGNSILNFNKVEGSKVLLNYQKPELAIETLYDPLGAQKNNNASNNPGLIDCYNYNYILTKRFDLEYVLPVKTDMIEDLKYIEPVVWECGTQNINFENTVQTEKGQIYVLSGLEGMLYTVGSSDGKGGSEVPYNGDDGVETEMDCLINGIELWYGAMGGERTLYKASTYNGNKVCPVTRYKYHFTSNSGYIEHHYPDNETLNNQIDNYGVLNLPINKDRYLEIFTGDMIKIFYPYLFRVDLDTSKGFISEDAKDQLDIFLDDYDSRSDYDFDLKNFLKEKADFNIDIGGEIKTVKYYDFLAFGLYWNSLDNVSAKYKFIMENYLSDQVGGNPYEFILPKNKKMYEIAYLGAHGDAQNMYVKMDPEIKINPEVEPNPKSEKKESYLDTQYENNLLNYNKLSICALNSDSQIKSVDDVGDKKELFKCSPPDGVPIREWLPAIECWLGNLLPVDISFGEGVCGASGLFGSDDEKEEYERLLSEENGENNDSNKNGIKDCVENKLSDEGSLNLSLGSTIEHFNTSGILKTEVFDKDNKKILRDNSSYIHYSLKKIIDISTNEVIYDSSVDDFTEKRDIINEYVTFSPLTIKSVYGSTEYSFATKNKESDIYFDSNLNLKNSSNQSVVEIDSETILVKVRSDKLFLNNIVFDEEGKSTLSKTAAIANNETNVYLSVGNEEFITNQESGIINKNSIVFKLLNIDKGSNQEINFPIDVIIKNSKDDVTFDEKINSIDSLKELYGIEKAGTYTIKVIDRNEYSIKSTFEILAGAPEKLNIDLGTSIIEAGGSISTNLVSIFDNFDNIVSGDIYDFELDILGDSIVFEENDLKELKQSTFEGFKAFRLKSLDEIGNSKIKIDVYENDEKILTSNKNIRVLTDIKLDINFSDALRVGNNSYSADLVFKDKNDNILLDLNSRVYMSSYNEYIKLENPYTEITNGKATINFSTKIFARENVDFTFRLEGFEQEIIKYETIFPGEPMNISLVSTKEKLEASLDAETYIKVELEDIYNNKVFTDNDSVISLYIDEKSKKIIDTNTFEQTLIKGVTTFKLNAKELPGTAYLRFTIDKKLEENEFVIGEEDKEIRIKGLSENVIDLETFYFYKKDHITGRKYNALYTTLLGAEYGDITKKDYLAGAILFDKDNRALAVTSLLNSPYNHKDALTVLENGVISKVYEGSDLTQDLTINLKIDLNGNYYLDLFNNGLNVYIGKIYLNFDDLIIANDIYTYIENNKNIDLKTLLRLGDFDIVGANNKIILENLLRTKNNSLIIYLESSEYYLRNLYSKEGKSVAISYNDPFSTEFSLNFFSRESNDTYENFDKNSDLGWGAGNKSLLAFSTGQNVGNATKDFMSVGSINLGDPIISLKKIKKEAYGIDKKFDSTIGTRLNQYDILSYNVFDYNADSRDDILLLENNGYLSLLENTNSPKKFLDQKKLARIIDLGENELVGTGDFSGDEYEDIFFVNNKGKPFLLNNLNKDFIRIDLTENFNLKGGIIKAKTFDMDNDGVTDIVTLDNHGEINIFYGKTNSVFFDKKTVSSGYGITLNSDIKNDLGAVYFEGLIQEFNNDPIYSPKSAEDMVPVELLENLMFEKISYDIGDDIDNVSYIKESTFNLMNDSGARNAIGQTTFIKSDFSKHVGLSVEKVYKDLNGGDLHAGDIVNVKVKLKNTTYSTLNDIVYLENIPESFKIDDKSIITDKDVIIKGKIDKYKFYIDKFNLNSGTELIIEYQLTTRSLTYSSIKVGLYEKDEAGDDRYGDIIVSASRYNCGGDSDIFRSIAKRSYKKGIQYEKCDESELPEKLSINDLDENDNNIPDYIDEISEDMESSKNYAETAIDEYNEDNLIEEDVNIFDDSESLSDKIDELSSDIDYFIEGFGCGFGGGSCFGMPINWAPLAPGSDPVVLGRLIGDGLIIDEGIPVLSSLTWIPAGSKCVPTFWPMSPLSTGCVGLGAGGIFGVDSVTNSFRFFISPTLTGGIGAAACFGSTARIAGSIPPKGFNPFIPGGNCIVVAAPLPNLCEDEEISSDPSSIGPVQQYGGGGGSGAGTGGGSDDGNGYGIVNGNCSLGSDNRELPISEKIDTNLAKSYISFRGTGNITDNLRDSFDEAFDEINPSRAFQGIEGNKPLISINGGTLEGSDVSVGLDFANMSDGIVFRDVEELNQKRVAPFPRFITQWVNDQLEEFINKLTDFPTLFMILPDLSGIYNTDLKEYSKYLLDGTSEAYNNGVSSGPTQSSAVASVERQNSGIKEAYEFLGRVPFVKIESEIVNINVPVIDESAFESTITQWKLALESYEDQIKKASDSLSGIKPEDIIKAQNFSRSLKMNLTVLETYKDIPEQLASLAGKKQEYLEQILCNIETIGEITGGWLYRNGQRFKSWVELYLLVKAILKGWQLLADIFIDYDDECHECKNERYDSLGFQFQLVSMIIPKIPVVQFPKWPDVIIDLHNIRLDLSIVLPEFDFDKRPIILPAAPLIILPEFPGISINLPELPILPILEIPELPDIPSLPTINLPDLPPPPNLPKLWTSIEVVLKIIKLILKVMCILKKSPFVPEIRAGDQIAFLTESSGYRFFDFIDLTLPQFSFPFVDEIKVSSFVNLEFESDFIVEMAKTISQPVNDMSNDFIHMFDNTRIDNIDYSNKVPSNIEINIDPISYNNNISVYTLAKSISIGISNLTTYLLDESEELVGTKEFLSLVNEQLTGDYISKNPRFDELRKTFDVVNNYTYSREDRIIGHLEKANFEKFDLLKSIIEREIKQQKEFSKDIKDKIDGSFYKTISNDGIDDIKLYNTSLQKYNQAFIDSAKALSDPNYFDVDNLKADGKYLSENISKGLNGFSETYENQDYFASNTTNTNGYLAANTNGTRANNQTCSSDNSSYKRDYKGIYVIESKNGTEINYKLSDYLDHLKGDEIITEIDYDLDNDSDLLYSADNNLYLKENLKNKSGDKIYLSGVEVLDIDDNKFINGEIFYEAVNNATESLVANEFININFLASKRNDIFNYRLEYYSIVDKYLNEDNSSYSPEKIQNNIVDGFVHGDKNTIISEDEGTIIRNNIAYIYEVGNNIPKVRLKTKELINIGEISIDGNNNYPVIASGRQLYTGGSSAIIYYYEGYNEEQKELKIDAHSNVEFIEGIKIYEIRGDLYIPSDKNIILNANEIYDYIDLPIMYDTKIDITGDFNSTASTHIGIKFYDDTNINLDFRDIKSYRLYDLGFMSNNYSIILSEKNDYLYSRIQVIKEGIFGTKTSQILLSPQLESDKYAPEIEFNNKISIPVYQKQMVDFTNSIYENTGHENIVKVEIEGLDSDKYEIFKTNNKIRVNFGEFENIFTTKINFILTDLNGNVGTKEIDFEVYPPIPEIDSYSGSTIKGFINEVLNDEPINIYRYRGGVVKKLETFDNNTKVNTISGEFDFKLSTIESNKIDIVSSGSTIITIDENTGKIDLLSSLYKIETTINENYFVNILVLPLVGEPIFSQIIKLNSEKNKITITDSFSDLDDIGMYLRLTNNDFDYYSIPDNAEYNPGTIVIFRKTDLNKEALFAILPNSKIKNLNDFYKIEYSSYGDYIVIKLIDKHFDSDVGELLFKIDNSYVIK